MPKKAEPKSAKAKPAKPKAKAKRSNAKVLARVKSADFVGSVMAPSEVGGPTEAKTPPEVAFVGRSNVGKSSLLNALTNRRNLARTSKMPGRTQRANLFDVRCAQTRPPTEATLRFVDLPGYGHAKAPIAIRSGFGPLIERWLLESKNLAVAAILIDARRDFSEEMLNFLLWLQQHNIPTEVVFTKVDKLPRNQRLQVLLKLGSEYGLGKRFQSTSSTSGEGIDELLKYLLRRAYPAKRSAMAAD